VIGSSFPFTVNNHPLMTFNATKSCS
jgi:hypothetical protein